jgi:hypothetical protein
MKERARNHVFRVSEEILHFSENQKTPFGNALSGFDDSKSS